MKIRNAYVYCLLVVIHAAVICVAFPAVFRFNSDIIFCNWGDGIKNYFNLISYINEPLSTDGLFKYNTFAYPFGDYVYYTDNTPLFAIPYRWFCLHVHDVSAYTVAAFNAFIALNFIVTGLLTFYVFKALLGKNWYTFILAVILPWVSIQVLRIWAGHFNLSYSALVVGTMALAVAWHNNRERKTTRWILVAAMVSLLFCAFLMHGYYIAILSMFLGGMLFFMGAPAIRQAYGKLNLMLALLVPLAALTLVFTLLHFTDSYYSIRRDGAMGYDLTELKTNFLLLFTSYDFHSIGFPVASTKLLDTETMVYLGNIGLYAFGAIWLGSVLSTPFRKQVFGVQRNYFAHPLRKAIFMGGIVSLVVSFGECYNTNRELLKIVTPIPALNKLDTTQLALLIIGGAIATYGIILFLKPAARLRLQGIGKSWKLHPWKKAGVLLCIAIMIFLFIGRYAAPVVNILNPLFYLHFITNKVEQFRSLSRFIWPFFWSFNIWVMYTVLQLLTLYDRKVKTTVFVVFLLLGTVEMTDYILKLRTSAQYDNLFSEKSLKPFGELHLNMQQYQAILPIPYYIVGSEDYPHTIDDNNEWCIYTMQLSVKSRLPLMSCKMSRTPPMYSVALLNMVCNDDLSPELKSKLNKKPILVALNKTLVNDPNQVNLCAGDRPLTRELYSKANGFVARHQLTPIDSMGNVVFYSWVP